MKLANLLLLLVSRFLLSSTQCLVSNEEIDELDTMTENIPELNFEEEYSEVLDEPDENPDETKGCAVSIPELRGPTPLFLEPNTSNIWPHSNTGYMEFAPGEAVELFCSSGYLNPRGRSRSRLATCKSKTMFTIRGIEYDITTVLCSHWPTVGAHKTGATCNGGILIETGFNLGNRFVKQLEVCFDDQTEVTRYVYHTLTPGCMYIQNHVLPPTNVPTGFFSRTVNTLYTNSVFMTRGPLAAKADFVYGTEQRGSFLYLNAAPQWKSLRNTNWQAIELATRIWVTKKNLYIDCYTGLYGITTLPNRFGVEIPLYMDYKGDQGMIPVPMLYFRVIIDPLNKKGVVVISVNNPHLTLEQIQKDYILCPDVSHRITLMDNINKRDIYAGYSYACEVPAFAAKNPYLPGFKVRSLLV